jgi:hypothetical protein
MKWASFFLRMQLMIQGLCLLITLTVFLSCKHQHSRLPPSQTGDSYTDSAKKKPPDITITIPELIIDSTSLSVPGSRFLLKIRKLADAEAGTTAASLSFYSYERGEWRLRSLFPRLELMGDYFFASFHDFNEDGVNDLQLSIGTGIRGSNEFFYLFFLNQKSKQLIKAKGVETIVNPLYDSSAHQIISMVLVGNTSIFTQYAIISGDSLVKESEAELWVENGKTIQRKTFYDRTGKRTEIRYDSLTDGGESRFSPW